jgi:hypothetical protein
MGSRAGQPHLLQNISHGGTKAQRREVIRKPDVSFLPLFTKKEIKYSRECAT